jgi:hypothetical protein
MVADLSHTEMSEGNVMASPNGSRDRAAPAGTLSHDQPKDFSDLGLDVPPEYPGTRRRGDRVARLIVRFRANRTLEATWRQGGF